MMPIQPVNPKLTFDLLPDNKKMLSTGEKLALLNNINTAIQQCAALQMEVSIKDPISPQATIAFLIESVYQIFPAAQASELIQQLTKRIQEIASNTPNLAQSSIPHLINESINLVFQAVVAKKINLSIRKGDENMVDDWKALLQLNDYYFKMSQEDYAKQRPVDFILVPIELLPEWYLNTLPE